MDYQDNLKIVEKILSREALLCQLAEEAVELSRDILVYRDAHAHKYLGFAPSVFASDYQSEWDDVVEEAADVDLVIEVVVDKICEGDECGIYDSTMKAAGTIAAALTDWNALKSIQKECHDVAKDALKLIRAAGTGNPTPITEEEAKRMLIFDMAAMKALLRKRFLGMDEKKIEEIKKQKAERWVHRLMGGIEDEGVHEN